MIYGDTPFSTKFWGLFKFSCKNKEDLKRTIAKEIYNYFCKEDPEQFDDFFLTAFEEIMTTDPRNEKFKAECQKQRNWEKRYKSRLVKYHSYFVIHACDADGLWIPTKKELENAMAEHFCKGDEEKIKDELKKFIA